VGRRSASEADDRYDCISGKRGQYSTPICTIALIPRERKVEIQRRQWEEESREYERTQAEERAAKAQQDSRDEIVQIVETWANAKRLEEFFADAEARIDALESDLRAKNAGSAGTSSEAHRECGCTREISPMEGAQRAAGCERGVRRGGG
jgi:hypothetical protein